MQDQNDGQWKEKNNFFIIKDGSKLRDRAKWSEMKSHILPNSTIPRTFLSSKRLDRLYIWLVVWTIVCCHAAWEVQFTPPVLVSVNGALVS